MRPSRVLVLVAWLNLVGCVNGGAEGTQLSASQLLTSPSSKPQECWCPFKFDLIARAGPRSLAFDLQRNIEASQRLPVLSPAYNESLPRRYDQRHVYEQLRVWESANCDKSLRLNASSSSQQQQRAHRSQKKNAEWLCYAQKPRITVLEELIAVIVIFGECITLGACFVDWVVVQVPGFALYAAHNVVGLVVSGVTSAAHHLLFAGWYLQWFPESNIYLIAPMLQIVLSFSTGLLYASATQRLAELHYERREMILQAQYPPPARSY